MINASSKDQVTILELTDQELEGIRGGWHHDSDRHESDREDRRFGFNDRRDFSERFSFRESFRFSHRDCDR